MTEKLFVFDAYGTLFDVHAGVIRLRGAIGPAADRLDPRLLSVGGFGTMMATLLLIAWLMYAGGPLWIFLVAAGLLAAALAELMAAREGGQEGSPDETSTSVIKSPKHVGP